MTMRDAAIRWAIAEPARIGAEQGIGWYYSPATGKIDRREELAARNARIVGGAIGAVAALVVVTAVAERAERRRARRALTATAAE